MAWDEDGNECDVLSKFEGGFVVQYVFESDEEPRWSSPTIVNAVYETPPTPRRLAVSAELDEQIKAKREELSRITAEIRNASSRNKELTGLLSQNKALERIADFIGGKITHYVLRSYSRYSVISVKEAKCQSESKNLRLLSLYGGSNGDLSWQLHKYSDASGSRHSDEECWPCTSEDEANDLARKMIREEIAATKAGNHISDSLSDSAKQFGVQIPFEHELKRLEIRKSIAIQAEQVRASELEKVRKSLEAIEAEMKALNATQSE